MLLSQPGMPYIVAKPVGNFWFLLYGVLTRGDIKEVNRGYFAFKIVIQF